MIWSIVHFLGWTFIVISAGYFSIKVPLIYGEAYCPEGNGGAPTLDAIVFPPIAAVAGIYFTQMSERHHQLTVSWSGLQYMGAWVVILILAILVFALVSAWGTRRRRLEAGPNSERA